MISCVKSDPPPKVPSPFEKFEDAARRIFSVPKKDVEKAELQKKKEREAREAEKPK